MVRMNAIVLGALMLAACTELNVNPRADGGGDPLDAPFDLLSDLPDAGGDAGAGGLAGDAGSSGGGHAGASSSDAGGAGGGAGGQGGAGAAGGAGGFTPSGGRGGAAGAAGGSAGRGGDGGGRGGGGGPRGGAGGATAGHGGATASCPASTANPCTPNMTDTAEEACCATGKRTRSRKCDPVDLPVGQLQRVVQLRRRTSGLYPGRQERVHEQGSVRQPGVHQRLRVGGMRAEERECVPVHTATTPTAAATTDVAPARTTGSGNSACPTRVSGAPTGRTAPRKIASADPRARTRALTVSRQAGIPALGSDSLPPRGEGQGGGSLARDDARGGLVLTKAVGRA